jgi:GNAT superfamily N-acetyltransferase
VTDTFKRPEPLNATHDLAGFSCGEISLDDWLRQRALKNSQIGATKTYVACPTDSNAVAGYYALCMGQILNRDVTGAMRRNMPPHIPAVILGRLAVDTKWQGHGLGQALLFDAVQRSLNVSQEVSARLVIVHALSEQAEAFYQKNGFTRLPVYSPTLALDLVKYKNAV